MRPFVLACYIGWMLGGLLAGAPHAAPAQPAEAQRHFATGNEQYEQGRYRQAIDAYRAALRAGFASGALHYNLGNAYFRAGDLGRAILHYEKARRLQPGDARLQHSLAVAHSRTASPPPPASRWQTLAAAVDPATAFFLGLAAYLVGTGVLGYRLWHGRDRLLDAAGLAPIALGLLLVALALGTSWLRTLDRRTVVVAPEAALHRSPMANAPRDTTLHAGAVLTLQRRQPGWTEVRLANGRVGWLPTEAVADV